MLGSVLSVLLGAALVGCVTERPLEFPTRTEPDSRERRPPGSVLDPPAARLDVEPAADSRRRLVAMREPLEPRQARQLIRRFFKELFAGESDTLLGLFGAGASASASSEQQSERARASWQRRLSRFDYASLAGEVVYRESDVETYSAADLTALGARRHLTLTPAADELVVRVPIVTTKKGAQRVFGEEIVFLVRAGQTGYVITQTAEPFEMR